MNKKLYEFIIYGYLDELDLFVSHHKRKLNRFIHILTIPCEWVSWTMGLTIFSLHWPISIVIALYLLFIQRKASYFASILHLGIAFFSEKLFHYFGGKSLTILSLSIFLQLISLFMQVVIGHWLIEKNNPSMNKRLTLNSVIVSLSLAMELLD